MKIRQLLAPAVVALAMSPFAAAFGQGLKYQKPPEAIEQLLEAPPTPTVRLSPDRRMMLIEQPATFPTIADVAAPRYRLAGIRFNPAANGPSVERYDVALQLQTLDVARPTEPRTITGLPAKLKAVDAVWAPDSKHAAFVAHATAPATGLELWVIDAATAHAHRVGTVKVNAVLGSPCSWMPDSAALLCKIVSATRGPAPKVSDVPLGPDVEESLGKVSPAPDLRGHAEDDRRREYLRVLRHRGARGGLTHRRGEGAPGQGADRARDAFARWQVCARGDRASAVQLYLPLLAVFRLLRRLCR